MLYQPFYQNLIGCDSSRVAASTDDMSNMELCVWIQEV